MGAAELMIASPRRRIRAHLPKVRTGCLTCRIRRIKCDEGKPSCLRCTSTGRTCDGYPKDESHLYRKGETKPRAILPDDAAKLYSVSSSSSLLFRKKAIKRHVRLSQPLHLLFNNEQEHRYFRLFCDKVALQLSGYFESGIWSQLILQASEQDGAIRHAVIAIGALDMVLERAKTSTSVPFSSELGRHHRFSLEQYSKSIASMRSATAQRSPSLRTTLLTCLLIFCFENLHGNFESALAQVQSGLRLLEDWHNKLERKSQETSKLPGAVNYLGSTFGILSPAPSLIEDEIVQAFGRLDMQAISWVDRRPAQYHSLAKQCGNVSISRMPSKFTSITEARVYWELVMRRLMHFICAANAPQVNVETDPSPLDENTDIQGGILNRNLSATRFIPNSALRDQQHHLAELALWHAAFHDLYALHSSAPSDKNFAGAIALQLRFKAARIALSCALCRSQMVFDDCISEFTDIVALAKILLSHSDSSNVFTFDLGFIAQLYVVGIRCRDRIVRRQAIALLLSKPWREGVWDSRLAGFMARVVMEIEEKGAGLLPSGESEGVAAAPTDIHEQVSIDPRLLESDSGLMDPLLQERRRDFWNKGADSEPAMDSSKAMVPDNARVMGTKVTFAAGATRLATMTCFLRDTNPATVTGTRVIRTHIRW